MGVFIWFKLSENLAIFSSELVRRGSETSSCSLKAQGLYGRSKRETKMETWRENTSWFCWVSGKPQIRKQLADNPPTEPGSHTGALRDRNDWVFLDVTENPPHATYQIAPPPTCTCNTLKRHGGLSGLHRERLNSGNSHWNLCYFPPVTSELPPLLAPHFQDKLEKPNGAMELKLCPLFPCLLPCNKASFLHRRPLPWAFHGAGDNKPTCSVTIPAPLLASSESHVENLWTEQNWFPISKRREEWMLGRKQIVSNTTNIRTRVHGFLSLLLCNYRIIYVNSSAMVLGRIADSIRWHYGQWPQDWHNQVHGR